MDTTERKTLLYVDDEVINLKLFEVTFKKYYSVLIAESGEKALEILQHNQNINFVISDMRMPGLNGLEFILLANNMYPHIHYFLLSGYALSDEIRQAMDANIIKQYFQKPLNRDTILQSLENCNA